MFPVFVWCSVLHMPYCVLSYLDLNYESLFNLYMEITLQIALALHENPNVSVDLFNIDSLFLSF